LLAIQKYLREKGLDAAVEAFKLEVNKDGSLVQLNYGMFESPRESQECCECRGLILDSARDFEVVAFPFYRFFNEGEGPAAKIDLANAVLQEKRDGSLLQLFWHPYRQCWQPATRGRILADGTVGKNGAKTFAQLFWGAASAYEMTEDNLNPDLCYVFELTGPENRVLTSYAKAELCLIGIRNLKTLNEYGNNALDEFAKIFNVPRPKQYTFNSRDDIEKILTDFKPTEEGFVLVDYSNQVNGNFPRIKIKNPRYLALKNLLGAGDDDLLNSKRLVELIQSGDMQEVLTYFPEYSKQIQTMQENLDKLGSEFDFEYSNIRNLGNDRKTYAAEAKKYRYPAVLFNLLDGKVANGKDYVLKMRPDVLLELLSEKEK
jgi:RNA ligase